MQDVDRRKIGPGAAQQLLVAHIQGRRDLRVLDDPRLVLVTLTAMCNGN